jgi:hypothetical protein
MLEKRRNRKSLDGTLVQIVENESLMGQSNNDNDASSYQYN